MFSCFGKNDHKLPPEDPGNISPISNENSLASPNLKKNSKASNSEKEHIFLRAAHNGYFSKVQEALNSNIDVNSCNSNGLNALHLASKGGHADIVQFLIDNGADIGAKTRKNNTAIHIASLAGSLEVVKILVKHGANINEQSQTGFTPLYMAAQENHVGVVKFLLDNGADINLSTTDNFTPLAVAIQQGHEETVSILLNKSNFLNSNDISNDIKLPPLHIATRKDDYHAVLLLLHHQEDVQAALTQASLNGFTALHVAAYYNSDKVGRLLLENGAPVDYTSKNNVTALHVAAKWGRNKMVKVLLEFNANVEMSTRDGIRPLHCAASQGHRDICALLIEHKANCNTRTKNGLVPLHMVAQGNHSELVEFFINQNSVNVNETSLDFLTPLHISSHCNNVEVAEALIKHGANVNDRALNGFVALHIAAKQNHVEFVEMLMSNLCMIDTQTESGFTALHIASIIGSESIAKKLVENNCEIDIPDQFDRTSLHMATIFNHFNIVVYLKEHGGSVDKQMKTGETCLMLAIKSEHKAIVEYLINQGASMSVSDSWGLTALHWATLVVRENILNSNCTDININEAIEIFKFVLDGCSRFDINRTTKNGISSLHLAADCGCLEIVHLLLDKGADINIISINGTTPLHIACKNNNSNVLLVLLESLSYDSLTMAYVSCPWSPMHFSSYFGSVDSTILLISHENDQTSVREKLRQRTPNGNTCLHLAVQQLQTDIVRVLLENDADFNLENEDGLSAFDMAKIVDDETIINLLGIDTTEMMTTDDKVYLFQREEFSDEEQLETLYMDSLNELEFFGIGKNSGEKCELQLSIMSLLDYATTIDSIRRADMSLKINNSLNRYRNITLSEIKTRELLIAAQPASMISTISSTNTEMSPFDVEKWDFHRVTDLPVNSGFLVSFLVDARGGYMQAQRMPQMKIFVPPDAAPAPTRIICHLLRPEGVANLPGMNDCDGFASRILQIHSSCSRFQKPILIEMPYIALLKSNDREIVILKKNADSDTWKKHSNTFTEETLKAEFGSLYESITPVDQLESNRICRIITTDVPTYFSLISQFQRDVNMIGPDGGYIESKTDKRIKLTFPQGALMKKIQIGLEVQHVDPGIINHVVGDNHKISLSPIITVEPKRRKFRDLIEIQMGLPKGVTKNDIQDLKLLFSISEYITDWEDVTSSTELVLLENTNCMAHSTKISARVWLIYAPNVPNISELANKIYALHCPTPYVGKFLSYARRHDQEECQIRCLLITDDTPDKTLECQESFELIATGPEVEVINKLQYQIECAGNIVAVTKSDEAILFPVQSFVENRITLPIRVRNQDEPFQGKIAFIPHFQSLSKQIVKPITTLDIIIPEIIIDMVGSFRNPDRKHRVKNATLERIKGCQAIAKTELDLKSVADAVGADWRALAEELELEADDINLVLNENCTDEEKAFMTLINWQTVLGFKATGNELNRALRQIGREDVVKSCIGDISFVEDEAEVKSAIEQLNNDDKKTHDECWDDIIASKGKPSGYNESVDDSMIVETGDDWSQSHRESKLSDISDDKSLVGESTHDSESEIKPLVDPSKAVTLIDRTSSEKTAAFLLLVNQLDEVLPHPVIHESYNSADKIEACEESVVKSFKTDKQVANVDQTISLLNLINCQINDDFVHVDTVIDLDDFFPEPQEIDVDTLSQSDLNDYGENRDQNEFVLEVCIPEDKVEGLIKNYEGCEITNTLMNMSRDENPKVNDKILQIDLLKRRRYTLDKARLLQHNETFHFHAPVSSLRRCFSVDSRRGRGIFSLCSQVNSLHEASILERGDWPSNEDLKNIQTLQIGVEDSDSPLDTLDNKNDIEISEIIQTDIKTEEENSKIESKSYLKDILPDSPITDLDDLSLCDELEQSNEKKEVLEPRIVAGPLMSTMPSHLDIDLDTISPVTAGNFVYTQPVLFDDDKIVAENDYDTEKKEDINICYKNENPDNFKVDNSEVHSTSRYSVAGQTACNAPFTEDKTVVNKDFELLNQQNTNLKETEITYNEPVDELETKMNVNQNFECPIQMKADVEIDSEHSGQFHNTDTDVKGVLNQLATDVVDQELLKDDLQSLDKECVKPYDCNIDINACTNESLSYAEPYSTDYQFIEKNIVEKEESEKNVENERTPESYRDDENINESKVNNNPQFETEKEISIRSDNFVYDPISDEFVTLDNDEALNQPEKHSVLHEVIESDPQIQTEVEEEVEVLPDGRIVNRKITRKQISRIITEKVTRDIEPENEENIDSKVTFESPPEVIETEEELPDGTILKRTISTSMKTTSTTAKTVTEKEISKDENSADSAAMRQSEALTDNGMDSSNTVSSLISDSAMYGPEESESDSRSTMTIEENLSNLDLTFEEYETADESFESD